MTGQDEGIRPIGYEDEVHQPFDVQAQTGQYAMWKLIGALAFLVILALTIFFIYQPGSRDRTDPVVISPSRTALKTPPPQNTGDLPNDPAVYSAGDSTAGAETLPATTQPEAPITLPKAVDVTETPTAGTQPQSQPQSQAPVVTPPRIAPSVKQPLTTSKPLPPGTRTNVPGQYLVQIASLRSYEEAEAAWNKISAKHSFLRGSLYDIKRADLGDKGVYYRLRIDGIAGRDQAKVICDKLKSNGQACFPTGR
jgi:cell division septation protein DedD